jgi:hypothetical protein
MKKYLGGRVFQLWEYRVSHGMMLVRSPMSPTEKMNVDIMFAGVEYLDLPRFLRELEIDDPTDADIAFAIDRLGKPLKNKQVIVLKAGSKRYVVVAAGVKVVESDMGMFESPFH